MFLIPIEEGKQQQTDGMGVTSSVTIKRQRLNHDDGSVTLSFRTIQYLSPQTVLAAATATTRRDNYFHVIYR